MQTKLDDKDQNVRDVIREAHEYSAALDQRESDDRSAAKIALLVLTLFVVACALVVCAARMMF